MNNNEFAVAIDSGKSDTKVVIINSSGAVVSKNVFPTKMSTDERQIASARNPLVISKVFECNGVISVVDNMDIDCETSKKNSKDDDIHKTCTLYGIAKNVPNGAVVNAAIGCPLDTFVRLQTKGDLLDSYINNLAPLGEVKCAISDHGNVMHKSFTIKNHIVLPEAMGIVLNRPELFNTNHRSAVVDCGGLNINIVQVTNGRIIPETCHTLSKGSKILYEKLMGALNEELADDEVGLSIGLMKEIIENGGVHNFEKRTAPIVADIVESHFNSIIDGIKQTNSWSNLKTLKLVFTGGTSILLKDYILKEFPSAIVNENGVFANAEGFAHYLYHSLNQ